MKYVSANQDQMDAAVSTRVHGPVVVTSEDIFFGATPDAARPAVQMTIRVAPCDISVRLLHQRLNKKFADQVPLLLDESAAGRNADALAVAECSARIAAALVTHLLSIETSSGAAPLRKDGACLWVDYLLSDPVVRGMRIAVAASAAALRDENGSWEWLDREMSDLRAICKAQRPPSQSLILINTARRCDVPVLRVGEDRSTWQFGWGERSEMFFGNTSNADGFFAQRLTKHRAVTRMFLQQLGIPTPFWCQFGQSADFEKVAELLGLPCVVKFENRETGKVFGSMAHDLAELKNAAAAAASYASSVVGEAVLDGDEHQLLVVEGDLIGAVRRKGEKEPWIDVTEEVHPQIRGIAEQVSDAFGFRCGSLDYVTSDISRPHDEVGGACVDVNPTMNLSNLVAAGTSEERLGRLVLGKKPGRIATTLLIAPRHQLKELRRAFLTSIEADRTIGLAWTGGARLGALAIGGEELPPHQRVNALLRYQSLRSLFILWSPEDLLQYGLPVDRLDTTIIIGDPPAKKWLALLEARSATVRQEGDPTILASQLTSEPAGAA